MGFCWYKRVEVKKQYLLWEKSGGNCFHASSIWLSFRSPYNSQYCRDSRNGIFSGNSSCQRKSSRNHSVVISYFPSDIIWPAWITDSASTFFCWYTNGYWDKEKNAGLSYLADRVKCSICIKWMISSGMCLRETANYGKMAGVEYAEVYWQHLGGGFQKETRVQNDLSEFLLKNYNRYWN